MALKGWTKTELSDKSGVARTTIDNWSTNRRRPSAKAVNAVADTLGVDRAQAHVLAGIVPADETADRTRKAFINAGYSSERADYFVSLIEGVRNGTIVITRRDSPAPSEEPAARRKSAG